MMRNVPSGATFPEAPNSAAPKRAPNQQLAVAPLSSTSDLNKFGAFGDWDILEGEPIGIQICIYK